MLSAILTRVSADTLLRSPLVYMQGKRINYFIAEQYIKGLVSQSMDNSFEGVRNGTWEIW